MAMRRTTLILVIVLVLLVAGGAAAYFMFPEQIDTLLKSNTNTTNTTTNTSETNTALPTNLSTSADLTGDTELSATIKAGTVDVQFTSLDRVEIFNQTEAPGGQEYVVMYYEGVEEADTTAVFNALDSAELVSGQQRYSRDVMKVATDVVQNDRGYIAFLVPTGTTGLALEVGTAGDKQTVKLP